MATAKKPSAKKPSAKKPTPLPYKLTIYRAAGAGKPVAGGPGHEILRVKDNTYLAVEVTPAKSHRFLYLVEREDSGLFQVLGVVVVKEAAKGARSIRIPGPGIYACAQRKGRINVFGADIDLPPRVLAAAFPTKGGDPVPTNGGTSLVGFDLRRAPFDPSSPAASNHVVTPAIQFAVAGLIDDWGEQSPNAEPWQYLCVLDVSSAGGVVEIARTSYADVAQSGGVLQFPSSAASALSVEQPGTIHLALSDHAASQAELAALIQSLPG